MLKDLQIEYQKNPIGLDVNPRFSWKIESEVENTIQVGYQIKVVQAGKMIWDSGEVEDDTSILVSYQGPALTPMKEYSLKVRVWDNYGHSQEATGYFETGLINEENWQGQWITHSLDGEEKASPIFQKDIVLRGKKVKKARIYATACGIYEISLNGNKVAEDFFAPGWTSYHNRLQYQTYDITNQITMENKLAITVGNGWYKGYLGFEEIPNNYGDRTAVKAMVVVEYEDGTKDVTGTDESWQITTGLVRSSEFYYGEVQDFTFVEEKTSAAIPLPEDEIRKIGKLVAQEVEPVRVTKRFPVIEKMVTPRGELVLDFGQNMAGLVEIKLPKLLGEKLVVRHAETLDKDGNFYVENLRTAVSIDTYVYTEDKIGKTVMPKFTFHGFRYIALEGIEGDIDVSGFTACALHSDMKETGSFSCDNEMINQLQNNINWGQRGNFIDVPTDCPQRNERLGWTGDAQVFCTTAGYNFQTAPFFKKWLRDLATETTMEWGVPHVVPNVLGNQAGAAAWSDAATIIPWNMYQMFGDKEILVEQFDSMKMWVDYIRNHCGKNGLWQSGFQYADWLALDAPASTEDRTGGTDKYLVANAYYAHSTEILYKTSQILGKEELAREYKELHSSIIEAINEEFVTKTGRMVSETQTACVLMLYFGLVKEEYRQKVLSTLELNLASRRNHLSTGFVGTPYICHCLSEEGKHDIAESIFLKENFPGWLYAVKKGATTIWERWDSILPNGDFDKSGMNSLNHYAYGSIGEWMYKKIAGINPLEPGYKKILIQPMLTRGMTTVNAVYDSVYGTIKSGWRCKDGKIVVDITIPANTTAEIRLPEKEEVITVGSGVYHYEYETETRLEMERFSLDSTLGEVLAEELAVEMFNQMVPGMLDNPMIQYAYGMALNELLGGAAETKPMYETVIAALNKQ